MHCKSNALIIKYVIIRPLGLSLYQSSVIVIVMKERVNCSISLSLYICVDIESHLRRVVPQRPSVWSILQNLIFFKTSRPPSSG